MGCLSGGVICALLIATAAAASPEPEGGGVAEAPDAGIAVTGAATPELTGRAADVAEAPDAGIVVTGAATPERTRGGVAEVPGPPDAGAFVTVVRGERPVLTELRGEELQEVPGAMGDPIRAVMSMPGVSSIHSGVSYPVVRGSSPASTALFIDGVQVPLLFHMFVGPSVIHPDLVDSLALYPGAPGPEYGHLLGGVVDARTREPGERPRLSAYLDLVNVGVFASVAFPETRTGFTFAARYSFTAWLIALGANASHLVKVPGQHEGETSTLGFADYQLRLDQALGPGKLRFFLFGSADDFGVESPDPLGGWMAHTLFHRGDLRYRWPMGPGEAEVGFTAGIDRLGYDGANRSGVEDIPPYGELSVLTTTERVAEPSFQARASWRGRPSPEVEVSFGADVDHRWAQLSAHQLLRADIERGAPEMERDLTADAAVGTTVGAWAQVRWTGLGPWEVTSGLRADDYHLVPGIDRVAFEPRISARRPLTDALDLHLAAGAFHQPPVAIIGMPVVDAGGLRYGLQEAAQATAGVTWRPWRGVEVSADAYFNPIFTAVDLDIFQSGALGFQIAGPTSGQLFPDIGVQRSRGYATGLELMVRHPLGGRWFGWLTYSLQRSRRWTTYATYDPGNGKATGLSSGWIPFGFEQTHVANGTLAYAFPGGWTAGVALHFNSGRPESGQLTSWTKVPDSGGGTAWIPADAAHVERLPAFFRADARVSKMWAFGDLKLEVSLDVLNASFQSEVVSYEYAYPLVRQPISIPLVLPVLGVKGSY